MSPRAHPTVDVLIPVYGQFDLVVAAIESVLGSTQQTKFEVHVIDDASEDLDLCATLKAKRLLEHVKLSRHDRNLGYTATCNLGITRNPDRDVVLLNSDATVFGDWLDRLRRTAYADKRIGTVTPLTDYAGISSYPRWLQANDELPDMPWDELDSLCSLTNSGSWIPAPTCIGFCMYLRRDCLNDVGPFDEYNFAEGYGEENDFCQRAAQKDWMSVLAMDTFVAHRGGCSFGDRKAELVPRAVARVARMHPTYLTQVEEFITWDPVRPYREGLDLARLKRINHGNGRLFLIPSCRQMMSTRFLASRWASKYQGSVELVGKLSRAGDVRLEYPGSQANFPNLPSLSLTGPTRRLSSALQACGIAQVSPHVGLAARRGSMRYLLEECRRAGVSVNWWW
jgi:GT2 family glycosyltransferase